MQRNVVKSLENGEYLCLQKNSHEGNVKEALGEFLVSRRKWDSTV